MRVDAVGRYTLLGESIDDAAGEAFDKSAKLLGLDYPGGPALARLAVQGRADAYALPRPLLHSGNLDFSFAGLKTAVLTQHRKLGLSPTAEQLADLAASTQAAIVEVLVKKSFSPTQRGHRPSRTPGALSRTGTVHRQRGDDRAGRSDAPAKRRGHSVNGLCLRRATPLATRPDRPGHPHRRLIS